MLIVKVRLNKYEETGELGGFKVYNHFFTRLIDNWFDTIITNKQLYKRISNRVVNTQYELFIKHHKDSVEKIIVLVDSTMNSKNIEELIRDMFEYLLLNKKSKVGSMIEKLTMTSIHNYNFTKTEAIMYLMNGVIYANNNLMYKRTILRTSTSKDLKSILKELNIETVTPILTKDSISLYYPGEHRIVEIVTP